MLLIFCSCVSRNTEINEKGYLYDPNTYASYYPLSLCLSAPPSCGLENLENHLARSRCRRPNLLKKGKKVHFFLDVKWILT
jgi:hypothetical protein